jgi:hypothetical protein
MKTGTPEEQVIANTAKRVVEDLMRVEAGLRSIATLDAAGNDAAKKIALQNTFRRQAKSLATTLTELRLANDLGCANALRVAAPAVKYDMLTEEQQKVLKDLQKEQAVTQKTEANKNRPHPYDGGAGRSAIFKGECRLCGVQGHWQKDKMCKTVDIQRKAARDANMQYQQQWAMSGGYSGQPMQQYGYGVPAQLAPAAAGYAGPSGMGGGGQQGVAAGQQMGPGGGGATLALTHHNQAPMGGTGN